MANSSNNAKILNTYLIIDSDNLFFGYKSGFINFLGTIANATEKNLISPWNDNTKLSENSNNLNENSHNHKLESHLIRKTISSLLKSDFLNPKDITDTLSILSKVLNKDETTNNLHLKSLCNIFHNSILYSICVENNKFVKKYNKTLDYSNVTKLINFVCDLVLLGFYNNTNVFNSYNYLYNYRNFINCYNDNNSVDFKICEFKPSTTNTKCKFIFITSLPSVLTEFLTIQEFFPKMSKCCNIVSHIEEMPPSDLKIASESYKIVSNNDSFIENTLAFFKLYNTNPNHVNTLISRPDYRGLKVNLFSKLTSYVSRTVGSYLQLSDQINLVGTVFPGNGRGWPLLGIPTANLRCENVPHLITGVYTGYAYIEGNSEVTRDQKITAIVSIGFNPHFFGESYSIETYLYHEFEYSLLDQQVHLTIEGFLRTDSKFDSLESLIQAIQQDLHLHRAILDTNG